MLLFCYIAVSTNRIREVGAMRIKGSKLNGEKYQEKNNRQRKYEAAAAATRNIDNLLRGEFCCLC